VPTPSPWPASGRPPSAPTSTRTPPPERAYVEAPAWGGPNIWFRGARGPKIAPNRLHLDLRPLTAMDEEAERLVALGATVVERFADITVMRDPEGNEFCVELGPGDRHEASGR
jgi:hypothetical protein